MFDLFSDIFSRGDNFLTRRDPRPKLIVAFVIVLAVLLSTKPWLPLLVVVLCQIASLAVGIPPKLFLKRLLAPGGMVAVLVVLQSFTKAGDPLISFSVMGWTLAATKQGFSAGALLAARVLAAVSVMLLVSLVTPAHRVFHALRCLGLPEAWVEIALLMYRYIFALVEQAADVAAAQRVRLGYSTVRRSLSSAGILAGTVLARSMDQAMRTHEAMTLRGYDGNMRFCALPPMDGADRALMWAGPMLAVAVFAALEWWLP